MALADKIPAVAAGYKLDGATEFDTNVAVRVRFFEDFFADAGATLPVPLGKLDTSAAGSPVTDYVADAVDGRYTLALAADNELEHLTLHFGDQLVISPTKKPKLKVRLKIKSDVTGASALFAAGDIFICGFASAHNATYDSVASSAWFRIEGANHDIRMESDDGTTDTDDKDTTINFAEDTFFTLEIDMSSLTDVKFYVDGALCTNGGKTTQTMAVGALAGTDLLQPYIVIKKAAAANFDHKVTVDYIEVTWDRT